MKKAEQAGATKARLIAVATELFAQRGYEAVPLDEIIRAAGVSKGALYHHFRSKEDLFEAVFRAQAEQSTEKIALAAMESDDPLEMMRRGCQAWLDTMMDPVARRFLCVDAPAALGWEKFRGLDEEYYLGLIRNTLATAMEQGRIREQNVDMAAHLAFAMLGEAAMMISKADDPEKARREAGEMIDRLVQNMAL